MLAGIPIKEAMIKRGDMLAFTLPPDQLILVSVLKELETKGKGDRIPVLGSKGEPAYIIHRSMLDRYLAKKALAGTPLADISKLTLQVFLNEEPELTAKVERGLATAKADDSLAIAKHEMDKSPDCQDVFATTNGKKDGEVVGWVTNVIVAEHSNVGGAKKQ